MNESRTYSFKDINAVVAGEEEPKLITLPPPPLPKVLRRRWRDGEKEADALRNAVD